MNANKILLPWIELEFLTLDNKFLYDCIKEQDSPFVNVRIRDTNQYGEILGSIHTMYKRMLYIFRTCGNAIITHYFDSRVYNFPKADHIRPYEEYKTAVCKAFAKFFDDNTKRSTNQYSIFKSPFKVLVELAYGINNTFNEDEIALLFSLLVEAMGIKTLLILSKDLRNNKKIDIACLTKNVYNVQDSESDKLDLYTFFNFSESKSVFSPVQNYFIDYTIVNPEEIDVDEKSFYLKDVPTNNLVSKAIGTNDRNLTTCWNDFCITKEARKSKWFSLLESYKSNYEKNSYPYLARIVNRNMGTCVAYNYGAEATASIMSWIAQNMTIYSDMFISFMREVVMKPGISSMQDASNTFNRAVMGDYDAYKSMMSRLYYYIRKSFPYSEETMGVEQITCPLKVLFIHAFHPYIQRYDCDDLTLLFISFAESIGVIKEIKDNITPQSIIRLAGDEGGKQKYHVYPVMILKKGNETLVHDVSAPVETIYWEMERGKNYQDFNPSQQNTYIPIIKGLRK